MILTVSVSGGCTRQFYRRDADAESYSILSAKTSNPQWSVPSIEIDPADGESNGLSMVLFALGGLALAGTGAGVGLMVARRRS